MFLVNEYYIKKVRQCVAIVFSKTINVNSSTVWLVFVSSGSDSGSEDSSEGFASSGACHPTASHPQHEHPLPGLSSLLLGPEDTGWNVSSHQICGFSILDKSFILYISELKVKESVGTSAVGICAECEELPSDY